MDNQSYNVRVPKRWVRIALIVGVTAMVVAPLTAIAAHTFTDVPNNHTFHNDIAWLADADVTKGCNPPANDQFCPNDFVTRGQMAAFIRRLAENQVVDAATALEASHAAHADSATTAGAAQDVANEVPGVALAGVSSWNSEVLTWFNRYGGEPTVSNPATGVFVVTFPGLEGRLGWEAIISATTSGGTCVTRQWSLGTNDTVELRIHTVSTGELTNGCSFDLVVHAANDVSGASAASVQSSPDQLEEAGG